MVWLLDSAKHEPTMPSRSFRKLSIMPKTQEVLNAPEPYLRKNKVVGRYRNLEEYLDIQFRLLREDFFRPLQEGVFQAELTCFGQTCITDKALVYNNVKINKTIVSYGRIIHVLDRESPEIKSGSLLVFSSDGFRTVLFAIVDQPDPPDEKAPPPSTLLHVHFVTESLDFVTLVADTYTVVEPRGYFEGYRHFLEAMQEITEYSLPFQRYIVNVQSSVTLPKYIENPCYDLFNSEGRRCFRARITDESTWPDAGVLGLDDSQLRAVMGALTSDFTLIQGPPGTGKTYVGSRIVEILLKNAPHCQILVVCFTNHALDHFLEKILKFTTSVVRVGRQCKNNNVEGYMLRNIRRVNRFKDGKFLGEQVASRISVDEEIEMSYEQMHRALKYDVSLQELQNYMSEEHRERLLLRDGESRDFATVTLAKWANLPHHMRPDVRDIMTSQEERRCKDPNYVNNCDKIRLCNLWASRYIEHIESQIQDLKDEADFYQESILDILDLMNLSVLQSARVIGMTTTGAAKYRRWLRKCQPEITVVDEAAAVLESHIITSLNLNTQHMILIGDHKQLKPQTTVYDLSKMYNMDTSLFERMVNNGVKCFQLNVQRRMRPTISNLLTPYIYEKLHDDTSVQSLPSVKGVYTDVFFLDHSFPESTVQGSQSRRNMFEARFVLALARYLMSQGYAASQITILVTYSLQVSAVQELSKVLTSRPNITTVDNFQGEENDIVIVSFVRSNNHRSIGFLGIPNRVCVALSRARMGLYCVGNFSLYSKCSPLWMKLVRKLEARKFIGSKLPVGCKKHSDKPVMIETAEDFSASVVKPCSESCDTSLSCGHSCPLPCHVDDRLHSTFECKECCLKTDLNKQVWPTSRSEPPEDVTSEAASYDYTDGIPCEGKRGAISKHVCHDETLFSCLKEDYSQCLSDQDEVYKESCCENADSKDICGGENAIATSKESTDKLSCPEDTYQRTVKFFSDQDTISVDSSSHHKLQIESCNKETVNTSNEVCKDGEACAKEPSNEVPHFRVHSESTGQFSLNLKEVHSFDSNRDHIIQIQNVLKDIDHFVKTSTTASPNKHSGSLPSAEHSSQHIVPLQKSSLCPQVCSLSFWEPGDKNNSLSYCLRHRAIWSPYYNQLLRIEPNQGDAMFQNIFRICYIT